MTHSQLEAMFLKEASEFMHFERIPPTERLHPRRDICVMLFLDKKQPGGDLMFVTGSGLECHLSIDVGELELTQEDVRYLSRCGIEYDLELYSFVLVMLPLPWQTRLNSCGDYLYRKAGVPYVPRKCHVRVYSDERPTEFLPANGEAIDDWSLYEFKGPLPDYEWDVPAVTTDN